MLPRVLYYYREAMRSYGLSRRDLEELQARKLRHMLTHAYRRVPLYHHWFRSTGITPEDIRGVDDLRRLPTLGRDEIHQRHLGSLIASKRDARRSISMKTTGTTGRGLRVLYDYRSADTDMALEFRIIRLAGVQPWDRGAEVFYGGGGTYPNDSPVASAWLSLRRIYRLTFGSAVSSLGVPGPRVATLWLRSDNLGRVASALRRLRPTVIYSRPSYLRRLAEILRLGGGVLPVPKLIVTGEYLSKRCGRELEELYQTELFDTYGSNEMGALASECKGHCGLHLNADFFVFEVLRDGEPVAPGEPGEVVITSLHNELMPLIRYRQGDSVVPMDGGRCNCGSNLPRLRVVEGRLEDGLLSKEGLRIPPGRIIEHLEGALGLRDYQVIQRDSRRVRLRLPSTLDTVQVIVHVQEYLGSLLGGDIDLEVETVPDGELPVKYRSVISQVKDPNSASVSGR